MKVGKVRFGFWMMWGAVGLKVIDLSSGRDLLIQGLAVAGAFLIFDSCLAWFEENG